MRGSAARDLYDRSSRGDSNAPRTKSLLGDRYQPTPQPNPARSSDAAVRDAGRSKPAPAPADAIRAGSARGDSRATVKSDAGHRPADVVRGRTEPANPIRGGTSIAAAGAPRSMTSSTIVRQTTAPRLNPNSVTNRMVARSQPYQHGGHVRVYDPYCDVHPYAHVWGYQSPYHWHCGSGGFAWSFSLWHPWFAVRAGLWGDCHRDWWWYRSTCYSPPSSCYWWYPSSVYCPTYLYVPSTVIYRETTYVEEAPAAAIQPAAAGGGKELAPRTLADKYLELGDFYFRAGRYGEAADAYARARTYAPNDAGVHLVLADAAFAEGDLHFAAHLIGEALRLDPSLATVKFDKRTLYGNATDFDAQMASLDRYLAEKPYDAMAHLVRGYNLLFSDRPLTAVAAFRRVLEIEPSNATASRFLAALETPEGASDAPLR